MAQLLSFLHCQPRLSCPSSSSGQYSTRNTVSQRVSRSRRSHPTRTRSEAEAPDEGIRKFEPGNKGVDCALLRVAAKGRIGYCLLPIARCTAAPMSAGLSATIDARRFEGGDLFRRRAAAAGDDRPGVAHALARRGGLAGDERGDRLRHVLLDVLGRLDLRRCRRSRRSSGSLRCPGSSWNSFSRSMKFVPMIGSPPMPTRSTGRGRGCQAARPLRRSACRSC